MKELICTQKDLSSVRLSVSRAKKTMPRRLEGRKAIESVRVALWKGSPWAKSASRSPPTSIMPRRGIKQRDHRQS